MMTATHARAASALGAPKLARSSLLEGRVCDCACACVGGPEALGAGCGESQSRDHATPRDRCAPLRYDGDLGDVAVAPN